MATVGVMNSEHFFSLFEQCMEEVDHVPPANRSKLIEIAAVFLRLAENCTHQFEPRQNAPASTQTQ
jgi:hypothetical protein